MSVTFVILGVLTWAIATFAIAYSHYQLGFNDGVNYQKSKQPRADKERT